MADGPDSEKLLVLPPSSGAPRKKYTKEGLFLPPNLAALILLDPWNEERFQRLIKLAPLRGQEDPYVRH